MRKLEKNVIKDKISTAAEVLGLTPYLKRYPRALSGGQRQRVAMGRAIVRDPQVFLLMSPYQTLMPNSVCKCGQKSESFING